jgi:polyamine oxidase
LQANNFTFDRKYGFSPDNLFSLDSRGFKTFIQEEANEFVGASQLRLSSVVKTISWSKSGVVVVLEDGTSIFGDYAVCTFSLGVLQNDDVKFVPSLPRMYILMLVSVGLLFDSFPAFKLEAIASMTMGTFTKIFLQFPKKFWFDTEVSILLNACVYYYTGIACRWHCTLTRSVGDILSGRVWTMITF